MSATAGRRAILFSFAGVADEGSKGAAIQAYDGATGRALEFEVSPAGDAFVVTGEAAGGTRRRELRASDGRSLAVLPPPPARR